MVVYEPRDIAWTEGEKEREGQKLSGIDVGMLEVARNHLMKGVRCFCGASQIFLLVFILILH